jgi:hypothetical protein
MRLTELLFAGDPSGVRHASEQVSDVTLGGVRQAAIRKNDSAAPRTRVGWSSQCSPSAERQPDRLTCGVRVLTMFPSPPRGEIGERTRSSITPSRSAHRAPHMLVDLTRFGHSPGEGVPRWRDEHVIPRYNSAGVRKFAFLVPAGASGTVESGLEPEKEPPGTFPTGYFEERQHILEWFAS